MFQLPISTEALRAYLPHRPPMVWIDRVTQLTTLGGECEVDISQAALYWDSDAQQILASAPVEWMAQAVGFCRAAAALRDFPERPPALAEAFLVGIRDFETKLLGGVVGGQCLQVRVELIRELAPLVLVKAEVWHAGHQISRAVLKLFGTSR
jgi:predicted hotdog family 3-hydroxylacyl-ACP dehydratase